MKKTIIFDGMNAFVRAYVTDPSVHPNGNPIGGVRGTLRILQKQIKERKPDEVVVVWDGAGGSRRKNQMNQSYKEGRTSPVNLNRNVEDALDENQRRKNMAWQQMRTIEYLNQLPVRQFMFDNVEADDVISYLVQSDAYEGWKKVIVSDDKDFYQLLFCENTALHRPRVEEDYDEEKVLEEYKIHPKNFTIARAMAGDSSDNIDGIYGIGLKRAKNHFSLLQEEERHKVDDIIEYAEDAEKDYKSYEKVKEKKQKLLDNYKIMQLYSPLLSPENKKEIREGLDEELPGYNRINFREMLRDDLFDSDQFKVLLTFARQKQIE